MKAHQWVIPGPLPVSPADDDGRLLLGAARCFHADEIAEAAKSRFG
jgi:hypothetical protein